MVVRQRGKAWFGVVVWLQIEKYWPVVRAGQREMEFAEFAEFAVQIKMYSAVLVVQRDYFGLVEREQLQKEMFLQFVVEFVRKQGLVVQKVKLLLWQLSARINWCLVAAPDLQLQTEKYPVEQVLVDQTVKFLDQMKDQKWLGQMQVLLAVQRDPAQQQVVGLVESVQKDCCLPVELRYYYWQVQKKAEMSVHQVQFQVA